VLQVKEHAPIFFFFYCFVLGPTFGSFKEFGGMSLGLVGGVGGWCMVCIRKGVENEVVVLCERTNA